MKAIFISFTLVILTVFLFACNKKKDTDNHALQGKWKLIQEKDPFGSGGNSEWHNVSNNHVQYLTFSLDGQYKRLDSSSGTVQQCAGLYHLRAENVLEVQTNCQSETERMTISEWTTNNLILDILGTEGIIRYKYVVER